VSNSPWSSSSSSPPSPSPPPPELAASASPALDTYPPGPAEVPEELLAPTAAYRRHAYLAFTAVLSFIALYFALTGWLMWTTYDSVRMALHPGAPSFGLIALAVFTGVLSLFLVKALVFVVKRRETSEELELTAAEHPRLFAFLAKMAEEAGAPRPHRVFVSAQVNASVFYRLSLLNLILPSKKNLELGLGLVNALTLSELKAVIAHELGHFAQRTMAVGRWVYVGQQIASHIVWQRDGIDRFLRELSSSDVRIAWVAWLFRLIIWAIRSVVDTLFTWVQMAKLALSREMERQADLVSVSLTGSDAPVHALYRIGAAEAAMERAAAFMNSEGRAGRAVLDVLAVQSHVLERMRDILGDPEFGRVPPLPGTAEDAASHRLFKRRLAHPPKMWASHPPNTEREENAKRRYLPAPLDDRSAWVLFDEPEVLRQRVTRQLYIEGKRPDQTPPIEESLRQLDAEHDQPYFDPGYRGAYLMRSPVDKVGELAQLYEGEEPVGDVAGELATLYPESLRAQLARRRELREEQATLRAVERGQLELQGKRLSYRGAEHPRRELPSLLSRTELELAEVERALAAHDRRCRTLHLAAARALGEQQPGWEAYLRGVLALLHYADHRERDLDDAIGALGNAVAVATADGRVSDAERERVLAAADDLYGTLRRVHRDAEDVTLCPEIARRLGPDGHQGSWADKLGELKLSSPSAANLGDWLGVIDSWAGSASAELGALRRAALGALLVAEKEVAEALRGGGAPPPPPSPLPRPPEQYRAFLPHHERPIQTRLGWWDRFATADGFFPAAARLLVAGSIVGLALWASASVHRDAESATHRSARSAAALASLSRSGPAGLSSLTVVNGLDRTVQVQLGAQPLTLAPGTSQQLQLPAGRLELEASADGERIEALSRNTAPDLGYVYNVAWATQVRSWSRSTGYQLLGARRWHIVSVSFTLGDAEAARAGGQLADASEHSLLLLAEPMSPEQAASEVLAGELVEMAASHARWDALDSPGLAGWMRLLAARDRTRLEWILELRRAAAPDSELLRRLGQELTQPAAAARKR
jgi:Zn-dependent protease with chaperone function